MLKLPIVLILLTLLGCGLNSDGVHTTVLHPIRKPIKSVKVFPCSKDQVCPPYGAFVIDRNNFLNLQENVINTEAYIKELEELLNSVTKGIN